MRNLVHYSLAQNCAYMLRIAAEKLNFENLNDVFCVYRKYFPKNFGGMKYAELIFYSLAPTAHIYCL